MKWVIIIFVVILMSSIALGNVCEINSLASKSSEYFMGTYQLKEGDAIFMGNFSIALTRIAEDKIILVDSARNKPTEVFKRSREIYPLGQEFYRFDNGLIVYVFIWGFREEKCGNTADVSFYNIRDSVNSLLRSGLSDRSLQVFGDFNNQFYSPDFFRAGDIVRGNDVYLLVNDIGGYTRDENSSINFSLYERNNQFIYSKTLKVGEEFLFNSKNGYENYARLVSTEPVFNSGVVNTASAEAGIEFRNQKGNTLVALDKTNKIDDAFDSDDKAIALDNKQTIFDNENISQIDEKSLDIKKFEEKKSFWKLFIDFWKRFFSKR